MKSQSTVHLLAVAATLLAMIIIASGLPPKLPTNHNKARTTRGFKNGASLSTARGFGKRGGYQIEASDLMTDPSREFFGQLLSERTDSDDAFPTDWLAEEMAGNPELTRLIINRFIDRNQDGELSADELLRSS